MTTRVEANMMRAGGQFTTVLDKLDQWDRAMTLDRIEAAYNEGLYDAQKVAESCWEGGRISSLIHALRGKARAKVDSTS